jgi:hypothetical protein
MEIETGISKVLPTGLYGAGLQAIAPETGVHFSKLPDIYLLQQLQGFYPDTSKTQS